MSAYFGQIKACAEVVELKHKLCLTVVEELVELRVLILIYKRQQILHNVRGLKLKALDNIEAGGCLHNVAELADLKGKKFQPKRNHVNRFLAEHPEAYLKPLDEVTLPDCMDFTRRWFERRLEEDPTADFTMEQIALSRAYTHFRELGLEGLVLYCDGKPVAMTMGSFLSEDTVDVHFEKADADYATAYAVINRAFARYIRDKYPQVKYLDREEDMGSPGLRKAKLSYQPHHLVEKCWAHYTGEDFNV